MKKQLARIAVCFLLSLAAAQTALAQGTITPNLGASMGFALQDGRHITIALINEGESLPTIRVASTGIPPNLGPVRLVYRMLECVVLDVDCRSDIDNLDFEEFTETVASNYGLKLNGHARCDDNSGWCVTQEWKGGNFLKQFFTTIHTTDDNSVGQNQFWQVCADRSSGLSKTDSVLNIQNKCIKFGVYEDDLLQNFIRRSGYSSGDYAQMYIDIYRDYASGNNLILPSNPSDPVTEFYIDVVASGSASIVIDGNHTKNTTAAFKMSESERGGESGPYTIACRDGAGWVEITHPDGTNDREQFCR